jgi:hypothetical protein
MHTKISIIELESKLNPLKGHELYLAIENHVVKAMSFHIQLYLVNN